MPILCTFIFSTEKWGPPTTWYHTTKSISQTISHTLPFITNTNAPGEKIKTWSTLHVTSREIMSWKLWSVKTGGTLVNLSESR